MKQSRESPSQQPSSLSPQRPNGNLPFQRSISNSSENEEYNEQVYKALSEGIYIGSGDYQIETQIFEQGEQNEEEDARRSDLYSPQSHPNNIKNEAPAIKPDLSTQQQQQDSENPSKEMEAHRPQESNQQVLIVEDQNKKVQAPNLNKLPSQEGQFMFAESMSHYESQMQFVYPSLMEESLQEEPAAKAQELDRINEEAEVKEETNVVQLEEIIEDQPQPIAHPVQQAFPAHQALASQIKKSESPKAEMQQIKEEPNYLPFIQSELLKFARHDARPKAKLVISGYEKQYFLKMETQLYHIDVHTQARQYSIKRRYSDFVALAEVISLQYSGFIIYPFPEKSIEHFRKMNFSAGSEQEKIVLIEKRLLELERYVNFLFVHQEISASSLLQVFIEESPAGFQKEMSSIQTISQSQENDLQLGVIEKGYNNIKKLVRSNFSFLRGYFAPEDPIINEKLEALKVRCKQHDELYSTIHDKLEGCSHQLEAFCAKIQKIAAISKQNSQFPNLESNIDSVLTFASKCSSSRTFCSQLSELIENHIVPDVKHYQLVFKNAISLVDYRQQLIAKVSSLEAQHYGLGQRLEERIYLFDNRFQRDWFDLHEEFDQNMAILYSKFSMGWRNHCHLMSRVWK